MKNHVSYKKKIMPKANVLSLPDMLHAKAGIHNNVPA